MNSSSSGRRLEGFLSGKGFYIVLFLCAAVIGVSAWMMAAGNETMNNDALQTSVNSSEDKRVETVIIPARPHKESPLEPELEAEAPAVSDEGPAEVPAPVDNIDSTPVEAAAPVFDWPLSGELDRGHSGDRLSYDVTMQDWRSHAGIDILAERGAAVQASSAGTVESVRQDDMFGTVVTIAHANGIRSIYANLEDSPAVAEGQWVEAGQAIGAVGHSALCEIGQPSHLHFAIQVDGRDVDPGEYLPG